MTDYFNIMKKIVNAMECWRPLLILTLVVLVRQSTSQTQSFRERPENDTIAEGGTAILKCSINNMAGILQWAKDGAILGTDRSIPGYHNLQMMGSVALGEHHLVVTNARLEDDAMYECQVTPSVGDHVALAASAYLCVIIPPTRPQIAGYPNGSLVEVSHTEATLNLTCTSTLGKPAAQIQWFRNGEEINDGIQYFVDDAGSKLQNGRSILTLQPTGKDNGAFYTCSAKNEALPNPMETIIQLSVMHPPEEPEIVGIIENRVLIAGDTLQLNCRARNGNPVARVYWFRDGEELDFSYHSEPTLAYNELAFTLRPSDNGALLQCKVENKVTPTPLVKEIRLTVLFPPEEVVIHGQEHGRLGEDISMSCVSAISNPAARITWRSPTQGEVEGDQTIVESSLGGFVTTSNYTVTLTNHLRNAEYGCIATNAALSASVMATIQLDVMYPPQHLKISGYTPGVTVRAGSPQSLTCTCTGGNPPANVTWWKGKKHIDGATRITNDIVANTISFLLKPTDNSATYRCKAINVATTTPLEKAVTLAVNFPPASLNISTVPAVARAGQPLTLKCRSSSSNPASQLSWWKDGLKIPGVNPGKVVNSRYGGKSTISSLQLLPTHEFDQQIYACRATNELLERAVSDGFTLDVLHVPNFPEDTPTTVDILEGEAKVLNFTVKSNPPTVTYSWFRDGAPLTGAARKRRAVNIPHFVIADGVLNITNITRAESGQFTIQAQNDEGVQNFTFTMNVQYPASISSITSDSMFDAGTTATLTCEADANPVKPSMVSWHRAGYDLSSSRVTATSTDSTATLVVENVVKDDTGEFTCEVTNGIGTKATAAAHLIVKYAPQIDTSPALGKAAAADGGVAIMRCQAEGAPEVTFKWKKGETELDTTGTRFQETTSKLTVIRYESQLHMYNVSKADYGIYKCVATNILGEDMREVVLDGTSRPDPPVGLQLVNVTHNSIALRWTAGFDGGATQQFQIRYAVRDKDAFTYEMVTPPLATVYVIRGLQLGTEYDITVRGSNSLGEGKFQQKSIKARTSAVAPISSKISSSDIPLLIILTVSIIGMLLLGFNILLILFFIRRRRRKLAKDSSSLSGTNSIEMYNSPTITEDSKSGSTYGRRSVADFPEDFKPYEDDDEMKRFLPPTNPSTYDPYGSLKHGGIHGPAYQPHRPYDGPRNNTMPGPQRAPPLREPIYEDDVPMPTSTGWPSQHSVSPYSSLPMAPHDTRPLAPPMMDRRHSPQEKDYAEQLRRNQLQNAPSIDRLPPPNQPLPRQTHNASDRDIPPPVPQRATLTIPDNSHKAAMPRPPATSNMPPLPKRNYTADDVAKEPERYTAPPSRTPQQPDISGHLV